MITRILISIAFVLVLAASVIAADNYFIIISDNSGQSFAALNGFPGKYWGRTIDKIYLAGGQNINWNAANLSSGIYLYRLTAKDFSADGRMLLIK